MWAHKKLEMQKLTTQNLGRGVKNGPCTKLNQTLYTYSVDPQKARNAKTIHPKCGDFTVYFASSGVDYP